MPSGLVWFDFSFLVISFGAFQSKPIFKRRNLTLVLARHLSTSSLLDHRSISIGQQKEPFSSYLSSILELSFVLAAPPSPPATAGHSPSSPLD